MIEEKDLFNINIEDLPGLSFNCSCGKKHSVDIEKLVVRTNILDELVKALEPFKKGKLFVVSDSNTYRVLGNRVVNRLQEKGFNYKSFMFEVGENDLIPDMNSVGRLLIELDNDVSIILAVGSGVLNDLSRIVAFRSKIPFAITCTAPSMDGYASVGSPLVVGNKKITFQAKYPYAIFADTSVMKDAPMEMIKAGYGDILGKLTAKADWQLARIMVKEYYCETTAQFVQNAVDKCINRTDGLTCRDEAAIYSLIEALILTGISMGLVGISRPASGTEHQLAHYWEIKAIERGMKHPLHGNAVGTATLITAMLYEMIADKLPQGIEYPSSSYVRRLLEKVGVKTNPRELGIDREMFMDGMLNAMYMRDKYTILRFCDEQGKLKKFAATLADRFYGHDGL